jgi:hypothetical protein
VLGPSTIELCALFFGERKFSVTLYVGKAFPKSDCKFSPIAGRKLQELGKRVGFHAVILSREVSCRNWIEPAAPGSRPSAGSTTSRCLAGSIVGSAV